MKKIISLTLSVCAAVSSLASAETANVVVATDAYRWVGDSIVQGDYKAYAVSPFEIHSSYHARPGYFMPIASEWKLKNDISPYPALNGHNKLLTAVYNMGLDEMLNAVEPDTTLRTGKEWAGVWTRDVSYSILLSMAYMQPEAARVSLMKKVNPEGQIIQDTGSGGAWPVSTDRMVWALAAFEIYKVSGDKDWLRTVYPIIANSMAKDEASIYSDQGLVKGETSFIDWREQSHPRWMQTADISQTEALGTNVVHAAAYSVLSQMASELGKKDEAAEYARKNADLAERINSRFWMDDKGYYGMYTYGREFPILNPRAETLGESLSILFDVAPKQRQQTITESNPLTPFGAAIFYPQISDIPSYHNNALWPFVASYWALANAKVGNEQGTLQAIGSVMRPAAMFATNKENFNLDNGDIFTELNSSNMLWSLSGNIALTTRILFGINFQTDGIRFAPFVPQSLADNRSLTSFPYRGAKLNITVEGYGSDLKEIYLNGKRLSSPFIPAKNLKGECTIRIVMNSSFTPMAVNNVPNKKAPITPNAYLCNSPELDGEEVPVNNLLSWNPIEYIDHYVVVCNGERVAETRATEYPAVTAGQWQVIGVANDGTESFASEPLYNGITTEVQFPGESLLISSDEVSYMPHETLQGFHGEGFIEIDHNSADIEMPIFIGQQGLYSVSLLYANGNGPVNTENRCAVRSLMLDGEKVGTLVLPQRGVANWNDRGLSSAVIIDVPEGDHTLTISFEAEDENMNLATNHALLDALVIRRL
jgi:hypothetical protein